MSLQEFNGLSQELSKELLEAVSGGYTGSDPMSEVNRRRYAHAVWVLKHKNADLSASRNALYMVTLSNAGTDYCEKIWGLIDPYKPWEEQAEGLPVQ
ncbi:MAG: hypothetical protein IK142_04705 [Clostridiales bacterium]|nr:hypothetical protein [Clostridiales bacterium]